MITSLSRSIRHRFLNELEAIKEGTLLLTTPDNERLRFGSGIGPEVRITIRGWNLLPALAARGDVALGEGYVAGLWDTDDLEAALVLLLRNAEDLSRFSRQSPLQRAAMTFVDRILRANSLKGSSRNIRAHYDVGNEFYQLWLDRSMSYSSALFEEGDDLEAAQARKNARILDLLGEGDRILEIGCGWGGFAEAAAERGRFVTGLTLSPSQAGYADARLDGRAEIRLEDYRKTEGKFDNIVSVEMIEAVGERWWPTYFQTLSDKLKEGGRAVIQSITVPDQNFSIYRERSDYIRRHIFPGGMLPCHSAMVDAAEKAGLALRSRHPFGKDYARTCRIWAGNMDRESRKIKALGYEESFLRSWRYYLLGCVATFSTGRTDVVQLEFAHQTISS